MSELMTYLMLLVTADFGLTLTVTESRKLKFFKTDKSKIFGSDKYEISV
jgi:hypothetical protein